MSFHTSLLIVLLSICLNVYAAAEADPEPHFPRLWDDHIDRFGEDESAEFEPSVNFEPFARAQPFNPFDDQINNQGYQPPNYHPTRNFNPNRRFPLIPQRLSLNQDLFTSNNRRYHENSQDNANLGAGYLQSFSRPSFQEQNFGQAQSDQIHQHPLAHIRPVKEVMVPIPESIQNVQTEGLPMFGNIPIVGILILKPQIPTRANIPWWSLAGAYPGLESPSPFPPTISQLNRGAPCSNFKDGGTCYERNECKRKGGRPINYCKNFAHFCCLFHMSCGESSDEIVSFFRNQAYPVRSKLNGGCSFTVNKRSTEYCGLRITAETLELPANIGYCEDAYVNLVINGRSFEPLCGDLTGQTWDVSMTGVESISLKFQTSQTIKLDWKLEITQVECSVETLKDTWPAAGSVPPSGPIESVSVDNVFVAPPVHNPVVDYKVDSKKCGISQALRDNKLSVRETAPQVDLMENDSSVEHSLNPLLTSFEWSVPVLSESDLYKYAGNPSLTDGRITFGQKAKQYEYPWQIAIYSKGRFHCGASLISDRHVLTAAHCLRRYQYTPHHLKFAIGDYDVSNTRDGETITRKSKKFYVHPGYSTATLKYDVGVAVLTQAVPLSRSVAPICLPPYDIPLSGTIPTVTGWGRNERNRLQKILMKLSAHVIDNAECDKRWVEKGAPAGVILNTMMCMDPQYGDSCKGDSGGPSILEYPSGSGVYVQVGIVSFGSATCTDKRLPGVYTRVGLLADWVRAQMK